METILSIAGKPGLYKLVSRGNRTLIVETLDETHKRVGESQDDGSQLSDDDRNTDGKQFPVVMFIVTCN